MTGVRHRPRAAPAPGERSRPAGAEPSPALAGPRRRRVGRVAVTPGARQPRGRKSRRGRQPGQRVEHRQPADDAPAAAGARLRRADAGRRRIRPGMALARLGGLRRRHDHRPLRRPPGPQPYDLVTDFGKIADPIADKAIMGAALICLSSLGDLPWWVTIVILGPRARHHRCCVSWSSGTASSRPAAAASSRRSLQGVAVGHVRAGADGLAGHR